MKLAQSLQDGVRKYVDWCDVRAPADVCKTVLSARLGVDCGPPSRGESPDRRTEA